MKLDDLDEFDEWSIPPDLPTKQASIEVIRKHAASNPKLRAVLEHLRSRYDSFRTESHISHSLKGGRSTTKLTKDLLEAREENALVHKQAEESKQRLGELDNKLSDVSQKRDHLLRQLEELKHQSLLITSICNNVKYHNARLEKYADAIVTLKRSESASLQESEKILSAVQFDIESKKEVDLERILLHRQSILEVIVEFDKRDRATLGDLLKQPEEDDDHAEKLANMMIQIKAEVLQDMQQHEANQKKIEELRNQLKDPPSAAAKGYALQSVHLHLLGILDELVPKSFDEPPTEPPTHKSNLKEELERELEHAHDSISILKGTLNKEFSTPPVDEAKLNRVLQDVTDLETLTLKLPRILRNHITKPTDPASSTPTDAIIHAARSLRNVELQLSNDHAKSQFQHAQNLKSLSEAELLSTFHRKSLESPVLATRELRDVYNVSDLATAWVEESNQKNVKNTEESRKKVDGIASRLAKIGELLERRKQLYRDVKTLHK